MKTVALVEIFRSVQGEGYHAGRPAIFVRAAGCNLSCVFAEGSVCDTPYQRATKKLTILEIMAEVQELAGGIMARAAWTTDTVHRPMVILTGGEPTLQPLFDQMVEAAAADGFYVAVETNGTHWTPGLSKCDWICVSPKYGIHQGSPSPNHNHNPQSPALHAAVVEEMADRADSEGGEYRYVIGSRGAHVPSYNAAFRHYVSPAVISDGEGLEWKTGKFPGFVAGALERCQEIVWEDPRWRISLQQHKLMGAR